MVTNASPQQIKSYFDVAVLLVNALYWRVQTTEDIIEVCTFRAKESWLAELYAGWFKKPGYLNNVYGSIETDAWRGISVLTLYTMTS